MRRQNGFTLIELMVVVAIVGIIAGIAYPSYLKSMQKGRRAEAKTELTRFAQALERCYSSNGTYQNTGCSTVEDSSGNFLSGLQSSPNKYYNITASTLSPIAYKLTATAVSGGPQANDTGCTVMNLDNTGKRTSGSTSATTDTGSCW
ncbi:MAG TPA: type IV pilin protein [Gammaproteobacteria bacterium]|jgi:type IV pilus assembly protein PilE